MLLVVTVDIKKGSKTITQIITLTFVFINISSLNCLLPTNFSGVRDGKGGGKNLLLHMLQ